MIRHRRIAQREPRNAPHGRWWLCGIALAMSCASSAAALPTPSRSAHLADEFRAGVEVLAADSMEGRGLTTAGILRAANWIERELRSRGLKPAFEKSYRQPFDIKTGVVPLSGNHLEGVSDSAWVPLGFSSSGAFSGEIAFLGYGIDAPPLAFSEFDGADVRGKVALMLRYEPQEKDSSSRFDGKKPSRWSALRYKVLRARERGAAAIVFVTGPLQDGPQGAELDEYRKLLAERIIRPRSLEIFVMKADGTGARQLTKNGAANFCPTFHSDGKRIFYSSNAAAADPREFDVWMVDKREGEPERITSAPGFDGFPHMSPDGRWLVWASNRADPASHETNLFIARWVE